VRDRSSPVSLTGCVLATSMGQTLRSGTSDAARLCGASASITRLARRSCDSRYTEIVPGEETLEIPSRSFPGACDRKLAGAERRLRGAIAHAAPRARLVAEAERVRRAHMGVVKARIHDAAFPTETEDAEGQHYVARLTAAGRRWMALPVEAIIARYSAK
jgi:hypothetical protein